MRKIQHLQAPVASGGSPPSFLLVARRERQLWRVAAILCLGLFLGGLLSGLGLAALDFARGSLYVANASGVGRAQAEAFPVLRASITLLGLAGGLVVSASWINRRPLLSFITSAARFRWPLFGAGLLVFALVQGAATTWLGGAVIGAGSWGLGATIGFAAVIAIAYAPAVLAEELVFRGWLMQQIAAFDAGPIAAVLLSTLVFSVAHLQFEPLPMLSHFASGAAYAWAAVRLGGLEFALGGHLAKNTALTVFGGRSEGYALAVDLSSLAIANVLESLVVILLVELTARKRRWLPRSPV